MTIRRLLTQIRFWMFLGKGDKRTEYARKKKLVAEIGKNSQIPMTVPLYPKLVRIHDNVIIHHSVKLVTHDTLNSFLTKISDSYHFKNAESPCPIEIFDNVYIGMNSIICGNIRIGPNAVINAGSLVTNNVPPNSVVEGVPAKVVGKLDTYAKLRIMKDKVASYEFRRSGKEMIDQKTIEMVWERFDRKKDQKKAET